MSRFEFTQREFDTTVSDFVGTCRDTVWRHVRDLSVPVTSLDNYERQAVADRVAGYLEFEYQESELPPGIPLIVTGKGLMLFYDTDHSLVGVEIVSGGDIVLGKLIDVGATPVPTLECLAEASASKVPVYDETLSAVLLLDSPVYKTGLQANGTFCAEHDLSAYTIGVALAHPFDVHPVLS